MMYNYPFGRFPGFSKNYYQNPNYFLQNRPKPTNEPPKKNYSTSNFSPPSHSTYTNVDSPNVKSPKENLDRSFKAYSSYENEYFDFFGMKLQFDDLLILLLLFFLYKEGSDDIYLYIALFMLLLS